MDNSKIKEMLIFFLIVRPALIFVLFRGLNFFRFLYYLSEVEMFGTAESYVY